MCVMCLRMHQRIPFLRRLSALWEVGLEKGSDSCHLGVEEAAEGAKEQELGDYAGRACMAGQEVEGRRWPEL